jgi:hypothetical protein
LTFTLLLILLKAFLPLPLSELATKLSNNVTCRLARFFIEREVLILLDFVLVSKFLLVLFA